MAVVVRAAVRVEIQGVATAAAGEMWAVERVVVLAEARVEAARAAVAVVVRVADSVVLRAATR